ncbi:MAG: hypothetical protein MMC33_000086 [Icmadophila ericetorum]|nr:hypothetical protein [Icmadophila ericetorum]
MIGIQTASLTHHGRFLNDTELGFAIALLRISRQVHEEAVAIFYKFNKFRFWNWGAFHCFISIGGQDTKRHLRYITLPLPLPSDHENNEELLSLDDILHYTYNVSWPSDATLTFQTLPSLHEVTVVVKALDQIPKNTKVKIQGEPIRFFSSYLPKEEGILERKPVLFPSMAMLYKEQGWVVEEKGF